MKTVPIRDLRYHLKAIVDGVSEEGESVLITNSGDPVAVLMPIDKDRLATFLASEAPPVVRSA